MGLIRFLSGLIVGALIGGAAGLLLTPQSGEDFQRQVQKRIESVMEESRRARLPNAVPNLRRSLPRPNSIKTRLGSLDVYKPSKDRFPGKDSDAE